MGILRWCDLHARDADKPGWMAYPNRTHSISEGDGTRRHLFELMTRFLAQNLPRGRAAITD